ncbi:1116_t:CDS:10 [Funneliformis mosseae]|uniref:1116_t:CDS:1 n=1 Tax=Funneliformis mosseae TaxID=27381 RepID=A0A9N8YST6_FUNMO|nr:1116_t:CDS:10 [Funneliformis mosseae]
MYDLNPEICYADILTKNLNEYMAIHRNLAAKNRMQKQKLNAAIRKQSALLETKLKNGKITDTYANKKRDISELSRKLLHSAIGFIVLLIYSDSETIAVRNNLLYMFAFVFSAEILRFFSKSFNEMYIRVLGFMMREREKTEKYNGVISYLIGCIGVLTLFPKDIASISILILSWCDTAASFVGRRWGNYTYKFRNGKSLAGTLGAMTVGSIAAFIFWGLLKHDPESSSWVEEKSLLPLPILTILTGTIGGMSELIDLWGLDDNLVIPLLSGTILWILLRGLGLGARRKVMLCSNLLIQIKRGFRINSSGTFQQLQLEKEEAVSQTKSTFIDKSRKNVKKVLETNTQTYEILLDKRSLKTPGGSKLSIPYSKKILAYLIAGEWESQNHLLKQHSLPMVTIDAFDKDINTKQEVINNLLRCLDNDLICYQESYPDSLVELQQRHWVPILNWVQKTYNVEIKTTDGISGLKQPESTRKKLKDIIENFDSLKLSGFERATMLSKSFLIGLALVERKLSVEEASTASLIEIISQTMKWGKIESAHDVENESIKRQLGSVICAIMVSNN